MGTCSAGKGTTPEPLHFILCRRTDKPAVTQIGGLLLRLVMETAMVKVPGKVRMTVAMLLVPMLTRSAGAW